MKNGVVKNFGKFTEKYIVPESFFNKVAALRPATLLKRRLWHRYFSVNFPKFLRTPFLQKTSGRLLLKNLLFLEMFILHVYAFIYCSFTLHIQASV